MASAGPGARLQLTHLRARNCYSPLGRETLLLESHSPGTRGLGEGQRTRDQVLLRSYFSRPWSPHALRPGSPPARAQPGRGFRALAIGPAPAPR